MLFDTAGVINVYASSAFQLVQVEFDETIVSHEKLLALLSDAGYMGEIPMMVETGHPEEKASIFRNTATYMSVKKTVSFAQKAPYQGRPLWNCPGMGVIKKMDE